MISDFQICKDWFSHCDKVKHTNIQGANIESIQHNIRLWKDRQLNQGCPIISDEIIIEAAKKSGFKVGYKKRNYIVLILVRAVSNLDLVYIMMKNRLIIIFNIIIKLMPFIYYIILLKNKNIKVLR